MARVSTLRIANAGGYWGDDPRALERQLQGGKLDYIIMDFLAETTMSILQKQRQADPQGGFAHDFPGLVTRSLSLMMEKKVKLVTNAGGVNPMACATAVAEGAKKLGLSPRIGLVTGDDILGRVPSLAATPGMFANLENHEPFVTVANRVCAANVYFGAKPIAVALADGADLIITGRVYDAALALGPMIYELGWGYDDWDKLASGVVAGHLLECGAQATGGNFTDWQKIREFHEIGFPVVNMEASGVFVITKTSGSGGAVTVDTVKEQLVYEIADPKAYQTADVTADFTSVKVESAGTDRVRISDVKGGEPTSHYKVSMAYQNGFRCSGSVFICGPRAVEKAKRYADLFWRRCPELDERLTELVGLSAFHGAMAAGGEPGEIMLRLSARAVEKRPLEQFARLLPSLILSGPPGVTFSGGIPKPQEVVSYWPALLPKGAAKPTIGILVDGKMQGVREIEGSLVGAGSAGTPHPDVALKATLSLDEATTRAITRGTELEKLCLARSGDKGNTVNIGVIIRDPAHYPFLKRALSAQQVKNWFQEICKGRVLRYEMDNLPGFNFLLENALGGGGMTSLRLDALGKGFAQALLTRKLEVPDDILRETNK